MKKKWSILFFVTGLFSTIWFLIRVIPKPSRASYPCMKAASPYMAAFVIWLFSMFAGAFSFRKAMLKYKKYKYVSTAFFVLTGLIFVLVSISQNSLPVFANSKVLLDKNQSIGEAKGIFPGRVVWVWNNDATNENCTNVFGDGWFMSKNTNLQVVDSMTRQSVLTLTSCETIDHAWEKLFRHYNSGAGKGDVSYSSDEKIFIKINFVSSSSNTFTSDYTIKNTSRYGMCETSPQVVLSVLRQLVNDCGIPQDKIFVGDPIKHIYKHVFELWYDEFPNIHYIDHLGAYGREKAVDDGFPVIFYSDRGKVIKDASDGLYTQIKNADYLINIGALKAHARAGISLCAKNHFGSHTRAGASHLHPGLVYPNNFSTRTGYRKYRVQVDLMGHKMLGGKTILYMIDGLWGGSEANDPPRKWAMPPFNNDWSSSIFVSQDPVAIESVGFDFLKAEFTSDNPFGSYPQIEGVDDYLIQAADSSFWPVDIKYDPENDKAILKSLGVYENWNNSIDKMYSRNLNSGNGIELVFVDQKDIQTAGKISLSNVDPEVKVYPNPFYSSVNIELKSDSQNKLFTIYSLDGEVHFSGSCSSGLQQLDFSNLPAGIYFLKFDGKGKSIKLIKKETK
jgi:hypothetical protein